MGFGLASSHRWEEPELAYRQYHAAHCQGNFSRMGSVQLAQVEDDLWVANLIGQHKVRRHNKDDNGPPPIRYEAVRKGLSRVAHKAAILGASVVHMPRIDCGLAGGTWEKMEPIIVQELSVHDIPVMVYDDMICPQKRERLPNWMFQ
jgi:hypothetical protein